MLRKTSVSIRQFLFWQFTKSSRVGKTNFFRVKEDCLFTVGDLKRMVSFDFNNRTRR